MRVSKATAHRATLATGQAALAVWDAEGERLKQEAPQAPAGAEKQAMSGDGAMVHLVGGEWVEVKTLAIGEVTRDTRRGAGTGHLSDCWRLGAPTLALVCGSLSQLTDTREIDLFAETRSAHAVPDLSRGGLAHWLRQRGKRQ